MSSIAKGDEVLTNGGLVGRATPVAESGYIAIALNDTTEAVIKRDFVAAVLPKGTHEGAVIHFSLRELPCWEPLSSL